MRPMKRLSLVIACRSKSDPKLAELLESIEAQNFPQEELEILVITEGTSESAKAIGIRQAEGEIIGILASDNVLIHPHTLDMMCVYAKKYGAAYPLEYHYQENDDALNRYFSLIGGNDPLSFYMKKNDRASKITNEHNELGSIGDNGFFVRRELIEKTDLDNYYHIDNAVEATLGRIKAVHGYYIWHKTGGNIFSFFKKRYKYGFQHAFNKNRRWHLVDFSKKEDVWRLVWYVVASLTVIHPLWTSIKGYRKLQDLAWFIHPIACLCTVFTYGLLTIRVSLLRMYQLLFVLTDARTA